MQKKSSGKKQPLPFGRLVLMGGVFACCSAALIGRLAYFQLFNY